MLEFFQKLDFEKVAGVAVGTVALVISSSIFLSMLAAKYTSMFERYRALASEYRAAKASEPRRESLKRQIDIYHERVHRIRRAQCIGAFAILTFIVTIICASVAAGLPQLMVPKLIGSLSLVAGLLLIAVATGFEIRENYLSWVAIDSEIADFPELASHTNNSEQRVGQHAPAHG